MKIMISLSGIIPTKPNFITIDKSRFPITKPAKPNSIIDKSRFPITKPAKPNSIIDKSRFPIAKPTKPVLVNKQLSVKPQKVLNKNLDIAGHVEKPSLLHNIKQKALTTLHGMPKNMTEEENEAFHNLRNVKDDSPIEKETLRHKLKKGFNKALVGGLKIGATIAAGPLMMGILDPELEMFDKLGEKLQSKEELREEKRQVMKQYAQDVKSGKGPKSYPEYAKKIREIDKAMRNAKSRGENRYDGGNYDGGNNKNTNSKGNSRKGNLNEHIYTDTHKFRDKARGTIEKTDKLDYTRSV